MFINKLQALCYNEQIRYLTDPLGEQDIQYLVEEIIRVINEKYRFNRLW